MVGEQLLLENTDHSEMSSCLLMDLVCILNLSESPPFAINAIFSSVSAPEYFSGAKTILSGT